MIGRLFDGIQTLLAEAGESACYTLCLFDVALQYNAEHGKERELDLIEEFRKACQAGHIKYNWNDATDNNNFFVQYPALFLEQLTGHKWNVQHGPAYYEPGEREYLINRFERQRTGYTTGHFEREQFKPIKNSATVRYGKLVSTRICRVLN